MGSRNRVLSIQEKEDVVNLYKFGQSTVALAKKYGVVPNAINGILRRRNIKLRSPSDSHKKYKINETFFDSIDSQEKAYILGLFYADGSNNIRRYKAYISLSERDKDILLKIQSLISPDKPLLYSKRKNPNHSNRYMFYIDNKHISEKLEELGCVTNKTNILIFPSFLDKDLYNHFIRGYFDGDGHIGIYDESINFSITSTRSFCSSLEKIFGALSIHCRMNCRHPKTNPNIVSLVTGGSRQVQRLLDWIYQDATIFLQRKYDKYKFLKERNKEFDRKKAERYLGLVAGS